MDEYTSGVSSPKISLDKAKALAAEKYRRKLQVKRWFMATAAFACAVVLVVSVALVTDSRRIRYYDKSELTESYATYNSLKFNDDFGNLISGFEWIESDYTAYADYYIYYRDEKPVMLKAQVNAVTLNGAEKADIYIEITGDNLTCGQFEEYYNLKNKGTIKGDSYLYEKQSVAGEWVYTAYINANYVKYFIDIESPDENALSKYLNFIL